MNHEDYELMKYIFISFSHLIRYKYFNKMTFSEFKDIISENYDINNDETKVCVKLLAKYEHLIIVKNVYGIYVQELNISF